MDRKGTFIMLGIVVIAVIGFIVISFQRETIDTAINTDMNASTTDWENAPADKTGEVQVSEKTVVTAKHAYRNDAHIIAGEIPLPTPCHLLESQATVAPDKKEVFIVLTSSIKNGETCAERVTPARFKLTIKAAKTATFRATLNGQEVTLNLIEAGADDNLDNFELYIKG
jgi:hypothetical protein